MLQESLVCRLIYNICGYFAGIWPESFIARILRKIGAFFREMFSGSSILSFIGREGSIGKAYEDSFLFRLVDGLLNLPQRSLHPLYKKVEPALLQSVFFKELLFLLDRLHLLLAAFLFIVLVAPHEYYYNIYSTAAVAVLLLLYFIRTIIDGRTGFRTAAVNVFLVLFTVCVLLAEFTSIMPAGSLRFLAFYLTCILLVPVMIAVIRTRKDMSRLLAVMLAGLFIASVYGVYQQIIKVPVNPAWVDTKLSQGSMTRVYSFFYNPNNFSEVIIMLLPFCFAAFFNTKSVLARLICLTAAFPAFLSLVFTQTRTAWLAFPIAALVYLFFKEKRLIPIFLLLGVAMVPFLPRSILMRLRTIDFINDSSLKTRFQIWRTVLPILRDYWFTGLGLGNETLLRVSKNYHIFVSKGSIPSHSHDVYLQLWLETGFPGIVTFLAFIGATVKKSIKSLYRKTKDEYIKNVLIAGLASLAGILAMSLAEYVWFYQRVMLLFWAVLGIIAAALNIEEEETEASVGGSAARADGKCDACESMVGPDGKQGAAS